MQDLGTFVTLVVGAIGGGFAAPVELPTLDWRPQLHRARAMADCAPGFILMKAPETREPAIAAPRRTPRTEPPREREREPDRRRPRCLHLIAG